MVTTEAKIRSRFRKAQTAADMAGSVLDKQNAAWEKAEKVYNKAWRKYERALKRRDRILRAYLETVGLLDKGPEKKG